MRIGRHMPTNSKMVRAAEIAAQQLGCDAIQIFVSNPTGWKPAADDPVGNAKFVQAIQVLGLDPVVIHAPYLINLASPDDLIWEKSIALLTWTMQRAALIHAHYVIFHTGSHRGSGIEVGIARIAQAIMRILPETSATVELLLENDVGAGYALGHSFEQLAAILALLPQEYAARVGVCLDTAHLWGAGHDISTEAATREVLDHFDETIRLALLKVIHLNDTAMALGSHRDVHSRLGEGIIGNEGLRTLLNDPRIEHCVVLLETPIQTLEDGKEDWEHDKRHFETFRALLKTKA